VSKLGCSSRLVVILSILLLAMVLASFTFGPIGAKLFGVQVPPAIQVSKPHVALPSEAMFHVGDFKITNTLISSWITIIFLCTIFFFATRKMKMIPGRLQNFAEVVVDGIYGAIQGVSGEKHVKTFFPLVTTIFLYVATNAMMALIPIWGTWGPIEQKTEGTHTFAVIVPFLRAANTDINLTLSIALISFFFIEFLGFSKIGALHYIDSFFQFSELGKAFKELFKGNSKAFVSGLAFGFINIYVGILEILSHLIRIVSFTFRLFGNMTAGEILIGVMTFLVALVVPSIFYGFETLFGLLQALIFAGLTLVFGIMAVTPHHEEGAEEH
jgi:F-type H+-transporting ATPase subunit a